MSLVVFYVVMLQERNNVPEALINSSFKESRCQLIGLEYLVQSPVQKGICNEGIVIISTAIAGVGDSEK